MATGAQTSISSVTRNIDAREYFQSDTHCKDAFMRLRGRQDLCDVVLVVGDTGKRISAHSLILIASSDYFSALLSGPMRKPQEREITLNEVDGDALEELVNYCYTGELELRGNTIETVLATANYLKLKEVKEGCCDFFQRHLQPSNCLSFASFAEQMELEELLDDATWTIGEHFELVSGGEMGFNHKKPQIFDEVEPVSNTRCVSNHPDFFLLTANQLSEFISNDYLNTPSEEFVFRVLMKWIEYEPQNRRQHLTELLAQVRLPLLSPTFLAEEVEPLCNTVESQKLIVNALNSHLQLTSNSTQPRKKRSKSVANQLLAIYSRQDIYNRKYEVQIAGYNLHTHEWTIWSTPIEFRQGFAAALMDGNLIVVGGSLIGSPLNAVTSFNLNTTTSTEMPPLQTRRSRHCVAILNGSIYAIGGYDERQALNSVERWDPTIGAWSSVAPMNDARFDPGVAVLNGHLYVSGGYGLNQKLMTSVECYDPVENTWRSTAPMKEGRASHCLVAHNDYLFAIGGFVEYEDEECENEKYEDAENLIERYNPRTDYWITIICSPAIYGPTRSASHDPYIFIINQSKVYMIIIEDRCDNVNLQTFPKPYIESEKNVNLSCVELFPYEFSPSQNLDKV